MRNKKRNEEHTNKTADEKTNEAHMRKNKDK